MSNDDEGTSRRGGLPGWSVAPATPFRSCSCRIVSDAGGMHVEIDRACVFHAKPVNHARILDSDSSGRLRLMDSWGAPDIVQERRLAPRRENPIGHFDRADEPLVDRRKGQERRLVEMPAGPSAEVWSSPESLEDPEIRLITEQCLSLGAALTLALQALRTKIAVTPGLLANLEGIVARGREFWGARWPK